MKPTSCHRGKNPEYQTVGVKPTSRHRGKNQEYQTVGSNRPHVTVVKTQNTKPSGQTDLTLPWQKSKIPNRRAKPTSRYRGKNPEYQTVGSNRPHITVAKIQNTKPSGQTDLTATWQLINRRVKPTSRQRGNK